MKKLFGISLVAVFAAAPMMARATAVAGEPESLGSGATAEQQAAVIADADPLWKLAEADSTNDNNAASAGYVKGAYNAAIQAVNYVHDEVTGKQDTISDLATIRSGAAKGATSVQTVATGSTNGTVAVNGTDVAVKGLGSAAYTASSAYATSTQGGKADTAVQTVKVNGTALTEDSNHDVNLTVTSGTTAGTIKVNGAEVAVTGVLTSHQSIAGKANTDLDNLSTTGKANVSAQGTYSASATYTDGTVGKAIQGKADKATTLSGYGITNAYTKTEADGKFLTSHQDISGKVNNTGNFTADGDSSLIKNKTVVNAIKDTATAVDGKVNNAGNFTSDSDSSLIKSKTVVNAIKDTAAAVDGKVATSSLSDKSLNIDAASLKVNGTSVLTSHQSLTNYAKKTGVVETIKDVTLSQGTVTQGLSGSVSGTSGTVVTIMTKWNDHTQKTNKSAITSVSNGTLATNVSVGAPSINTASVVYTEQ